MTRDRLTIEDLEAWTTTGGHWRIVDLAGGRVVVDLCACTGEPMERAQSEDPSVIDYVAFHLHQSG